MRQSISIQCDRLCCLVMNSVVPCKMIRRADSEYSLITVFNVAAQASVYSD